MSRRRNRQPIPRRGVAKGDRLFNKRDATDPTYLVGQLGKQAPTKNQRCRVCVGAPHHPPELWRHTWRTQALRVDRVPPATAVENTEGESVRRTHPTDSRDHR